MFLLFEFHNNRKRHGGLQISQVPGLTKNFVDRFFQHPFERIVFVGWYMTFDSGGAKNLDSMGMRYGVLIIAHLK